MTRNGLHETQKTGGKHNSVDETALSKTTAARGFSERGTDPEQQMEFMDPEMPFETASARPVTSPIPIEILRHKMIASLPGRIAEHR